MVAEPIVSSAEVSFYLPFELPEANCIPLVRQWLATYRYTNPSDFDDAVLDATAATAAFDAPRAAYVPLWLFRSVATDVSYDLVFAAPAELVNDDHDEGNADAATSRALRHHQLRHYAAARSLSVGTDNRTLLESGAMHLRHEYVLACATTHVDHDLFAALVRTPRSFNSAAQRTPVPRIGRGSACVPAAAIVAAAAVADSGDYEQQKHRWQQQQQQQQCDDGPWRVPRITEQWPAAVLPVHISSDVALARRNLLGQCEQHCCAELKRRQGALAAAATTSSSTEGSQLTTAPATLAATAAAAANEATAASATRVTAAAAGAFNAAAQLLSPPPPPQASSSANHAAASSPSQQPSSWGSWLFGGGGGGSGNATTRAASAASSPAPVTVSSLSSSSLPGAATPANATAVPPAVPIDAPLPLLHIATYGAHRHVDVALVLLPLYVVTYTYDEQTYTCYVSGRAPGVVVGQRPRGAGVVGTALRSALSYVTDTIPAAAPAVGATASAFDSSSNGASGGAAT